MFVFFQNIQAYLINIFEFLRTDVAQRTLCVFILTVSQAAPRLSCVKMRTSLSVHIQRSVGLVLTFKIKVATDLLRCPRVLPMASWSIMDSFQNQVVFNQSSTFYKFQWASVNSLFKAMKQRLWVQLIDRTFAQYADTHFIIFSIFPDLSLPTYPPVGRGEFALVLQISSNSASLVETFIFSQLIPFLAQKCETGF